MDGELSWALACGAVVVLCVCMRAGVLSTAFAFAALAVVLCASPTAPRARVSDVLAASARAAARVGDALQAHSARFREAPPPAGHAAEEKEEQEKEDKEEDRDRKRLQPTTQQMRRLQAALFEEYGLS